MVSFLAKVNFFQNLAENRVYFLLLTGRCYEAEIRLLSCTPIYNSLLE